MNKKWKNLPLKEKIKHWYACSPFEQSALALALTGLGGALAIFFDALFSQMGVEKTHGFNLIPKFVLVFIATCLWINVFIRQVLDFKRAKLESKGVATAAMIPTWFMTMMSIGSCIASIAIFDKKIDDIQELNRMALMVAGSIFMYVGLAADFCWYIYTIVLYFFIEKLKPEKDSLAPWLVPFVGIGIFAINVQGFDATYIPYILVNIVWWFAFINLIWLYPVLIYRHIKFPLKSHQQNSVAVFGAAPCLILMGFINGILLGPVDPTLNNTNNIQLTIDTYGGDWIITTIFAIQLPIVFALFIFLLVWFAKEAHRNPNYGTGGYTFPIAVNASSVLGIASLIIKNKDGPYFNTWSQDLGILFLVYGAIVLFAAIIIIGWVAITFVHYFIKDFNAKKPFEEKLDDINF